MGISWCTWHRCSRPSGRWLGVESEAASIAAFELTAGTLGSLRRALLCKGGSHEFASDLDLCGTQPVQQRYSQLLTEALLDQSGQQALQTVLLNGDTVVLHAFAVVQAINLLDHLDSLSHLSHSDQAGHKRCAGTGVGTLTCLSHVTEDLQSLGRGSVHQAGAHQTRPHLAVWHEIPLLREGGHGLKGLVQLLLAAIKLHQDAKSEVGRGNPVLLHALENPVDQVRSLVLGATVQDSVVDDGIVVDTTFLHATQDFHGLVQVTSHGVSLDDGRVGDAIGRAVVLIHRLNYLQHVLHVTNPCLRIHEGIAGCRVHSHTFAPHVVPKIHGSLRLASGCESFHENGAEHGVRLQVALLEELNGFIDLSVTDQGIKHAAVHDVIRLQTSLTLHLIPVVPALVGALEVGVGLDDGAVGGNRWPQVGLLEFVEESLQPPELLVPDVRLQNRVHQNLIRAGIDVGTVQEVQASADIFLSLRPLQRFEHNRHRVVVWRHIHLLHLCNGVPSLLEATIVHSRVQNAVVGDVVGLESRF
mmetsp:Transcript_44110/g.103061  ORF Transcript_44110/g.103061 Transcript_44110/m.103061 type:complete len:529 (-) Transcript_44110:1736-3322(-)